MTEVTVKWFGDEILKQLEEGLPDALFAAGEKLVKAAKARAPYGDGDLQDSAYVATREKSTYKKKKIHRKQVEAPPGGAVAGFSAFYAHMIEYGTKPHKIGKSGRLLKMPDGNFVRGPISHPGTRARPFMRPAIDEMKDQLSETIAVELRKKIEK